MYKICWKLKKKYDPFEIEHSGPVLRVTEQLDLGEVVTRYKTYDEAQELCSSINTFCTRGTHWVSIYNKEEDNCDLPDDFQSQSEDDLDGDD